MQRIKTEAGHKIVYQSNLYGITKATMDGFLRYAEGNLVKDSVARPPAPVTNIWRVGYATMVKLIRADSNAGRCSRFRWGASNVLASWEDEEDPEEDL